MILPPCLLSAPATLRTLVVSSYEQTPACGTLHLPPSLTQLRLIHVQRPVREALLAALDAQKIAVSSLTLQSFSLDRTGWQDWLRALGPSLSSLVLFIESPYRGNAPRRQEANDFLTAVQRSCPSLRNLGLFFYNLLHRGDNALSFSPSLALPASLRSLFVSAFISDRRDLQGSCAGMLDLLQVAARHGGIEDLSVKVHAPKLWDEETPMSIARAAASFPLRKLCLSLTCSNCIPPRHHSWLITDFLELADSSAWVLPLLPLLPASLEHLDLCFRSRTSILPAVLRAALRTLPNLGSIALNDCSHGPRGAAVRTPEAEEVFDPEPHAKEAAVAATMRELDGVFPLRSLRLFSASLRAAACEAELRRWRGEVREAARSRASWAIVRKGVERGQERRVRAAGAEDGSALLGLSSMERLPARALMTLSEFLAYRADSRVNVC
jgi:hypothetical protein